MSSTTVAVGENPTNENRRSHARRRFEQLTYATFGPENGGILINIGEGGVRFQGFRVVEMDQFIRVNFKLPGMDTPIEVSGNVTWTNDSGKGGGLRFADLNEEPRNLIRGWIAKDASLAAKSTEQVTIRPVAVGAPAVSGRIPIQSLPSGDENAQQKAAAVRPEPRPDPRNDEEWDISSQSPPPFVPDSRDFETPSALKREYIVFAAGVLIGCGVVLAAIVGIRMLGSTDRVATSTQAAPATEQVAVSPNSQDITVQAIDPNDRRSLPSASVVGKSFVSKTQFGQVAASETNAGQKKTTYHRNLALQAPHVTTPPSKSEVREPSIGVDGVPPGTITPLASSGPASPSLFPSANPANFVDAVPIEHGAPMYPLSAKQQHIEGLVKISASIGTDGVPRDLRLVSGNPILGQAAMDAIARWRYVPAVSGGVPVESRIVISVNFSSR